MKEPLNCSAMESVCRQRATLYPEESWKWLAEAEKWNHKAFEHLGITRQQATSCAEANSTYVRPSGGSQKHVSTGCVDGQ